MLSKHDKMSRDQIEFISLEDLVPRDHLVRKVEETVDFDFIYDLVEDKYSSNNGRPSVEPVVLFKMVFIQYLFGVRSMRQTIEEIKTNVAYRWFIGYPLSKEIPHFSTFSKNYERRFRDTDIFEQIFYRMQKKSMECVGHVIVAEKKVSAHAMLLFAAMNLKKLANWTWTSNTSKHFLSLKRYKPLKKYNFMSGLSTV